MLKVILAIVLTVLAGTVAGYVLYTRSNSDVATKTK